MKKIFFVLITFSIGCILSSCPGGISVTYKTIKSVNVLLYSFNEFGMYPYLEEFNKNELGIGVIFDSIIESNEIAQSYSLIRGAYAMEDPTQIIYTNAIDSLNVFTIYDFNEEHPAGSNVNDILLLLDGMGDTKIVNINQISSIDHHFKFSEVPQNDSLQFEISGRITNEKNFTLKTKLIILK